MFNLRRLFEVTIVVFSTLLMINPAYAEMAEHTTKVTDGVFAYGDPAAGYISMFVVTDDGVIVVEPANTKHSDAMLKAIRSGTNRTHKHYESFGR